MRNNVHMNGKRLHRTALRWAEKISRSEALARLIARKFSPSLAEKLISGRYDSELSDLYSSILIEEMAKDGIVLEGARAS